MKSYSSAVRSALASDQLALVQLILLQFPSGTMALNTSNWNFTWLGVTYLGAYGLGEISEITDSPGEVKGLTLSLAGGDPLRIALALDAADEVQGTAVTIRTALIEKTNYTILDAPIEWVGKCDTMSISEDGEKADIAVTVESGAVDLLRGNTSTYSDASQKALFPTDRAFEYVVSQVDKPVVWPAKEYFYK